MEYALKTGLKYIGIPVQADQPEETLEIFLGEEKVFEFKIPVCKNPEKVKYDYYGYINVEQYAGQELTLKGDFEESFFQKICETDDCSYEPEVRPLLHFTAPRGWNNDPAGLVYQDGIYQLYYQYNPMNTQWQNMSWGHAISRDLLHFEHMETAMVPDEHGAIFTGSAIVNERGLLGLPKDALLFYYTAAGDTDRWSKDKPFTQRIAYSLDNGKTIVKMPEATIGKIGPDTRDPKVFWHEESQAYVMVMYIQGNEFGIYRSENLKDWTKASHFVLEKAWECPDLYQLDCEGEKIWVFTSADGFYYLGEFDGYEFKTDAVRRYAYMNGLPYAAQTYSGVSDRVISVPWMRTLSVGKLHTGMMGIPRELKLVKRGEEKVLSMLPVREYEDTKKKITDFNCAGGKFAIFIPKPAVTEIELRPEEEGKISLYIFDQELTIRENEIFYKGQRSVFEEEIREIHVIVDREIIEVYINEGTGNVYYETCSDELQGSVVIDGCKGCGRIYIWQP